MSGCCPTESQSPLNSEFCSIRSPMERVFVGETNKVCFHQVLFWQKETALLPMWGTWGRLSVNPSMETTIPKCYPTKCEGSAPISAPQSPIESQDWAQIGWASCEGREEWMDWDRGSNSSRSWFSSGISLLLTLFFLRWGKWNSKN